MLSLACFSLDGYAFSEDSDESHKVTRHQGRWGVVKVINIAWRKMGCTVPSNEHESPLLGNKFNECFALSSRATASAWIFDRDLRALETLQLQRGVLDPSSHLRTWFFICHVTFDDCKLNLLKCHFMFTTGIVSANTHTISHQPYAIHASCTLEHMNIVQTRRLSVTLIWPSILTRMYSITTSIFVTENLLVRSLEK